MTKHAQTEWLVTKQTLVHPTHRRGLPMRATGTTVRCRCRLSICARAAFSEKFLCGAATPVLAVPGPVDGGGGGDGGMGRKPNDVDGGLGPDKRTWLGGGSRDVKKCKDDVSPHGQRRSRVHFDIDS